METRATEPGEAVVMELRPSAWAIVLRPLPLLVGILLATIVLGWAASALTAQSRDLGAFGLSPAAPRWIVAVGAAWTALIVAWNVLVRACRRYTLTRTRVAASGGVLHRARVEVPLANVQNIIVDRPFLQRLAGVGSVAVSTASANTPDLVWHIVRDPEAAASRIREAMGGRPKRPLVIGLAGGIGSGKSEVARALASRGCVVTDSDAEAKAMLDTPEVREQLVAWWGKAILDAGGRMDRRALADIVFKDEAERKRLEGLVHPMLKRSREALVARLAGSGAPALVIDAPLLYEAGVDAECDAVIFVDAPREARVARVRSSRGWDEAELTRREKVQLPLEAKRAKADVVIVNDQGVEVLRERASAALDRLVSAGARRRGA